jgi:translation initiation factor 3 subunit A
LGYKAKALDALHSVITSRKHKNNWTKATEKVMLKFIDLCVELKKGHIAKDGLHQYRNVTQQVPQSLEIVVKYFLDKARDAARYGSFHTFASVRLHASHNCSLEQFSVDFAWLKMSLLCIVYSIHRRY